jgi:hypothetical protein
LDPAELSKITTLPPTTEAPPRELPKHLADFKQYLESNCCYYSPPIAQAELIDVESKVAYQCHMKILIEARNVTWRETPHTWGNETFLGSSTIGKSKKYSLKCCLSDFLYDEIHIAFIRKTSVSILGISPFILRFNLTQLFTQNYLVNINLFCERSIARVNSTSW